MSSLEADREKEKGKKQKLKNHSMVNSKSRFLPQGAILLRVILLVVVLESGSKM